MFRQAVLRLTGWYLLLILIISLGFSTFIYLSSPQAVRFGLPRQSFNFNQSAFDPNGFVDAREAAVESIRHSLLESLLEFNVLVLLIGGGVSYFLALRTLRPIEESLDAQSRFTADASHELRTPLTAMRSEIEVALRDSKLGKAEAVALLRSNLEEVGHLETLSAGLLKLAQHDGSDAVLEPTSLLDTVEVALQRFTKTATALKITIHNEVEDVDVHGEADSLVELVGILIDNAIKYGSEGGDIWITAKDSGQQVRLSVRDNGVGIKALDLPHIFSRFYRADSSRSKTDVSGYGLGLSIAQKIAAAQGGFIEAVSTAGKGTTFTVVLLRAKG